MKTASRSGLVATTAALLLSAYAGTASATHKSWVLRELGSSCFISSPQPHAKGNGSFTMYKDTGWDMVCPVTLSGMFASTGQLSFQIPQWAAALDGVVYVYNASAQSTVRCSATVIAWNDSIYWSGEVASVGQGYKSVTVNSNASDWGGSLGSGSVSIESLQYKCIVPKNSTVLGHSTRICQRDANCHS